MFIWKERKREESEVVVSEDEDDVSVGKRE